MNYDYFVEFEEHKGINSSKLPTNFCLKDCLENLYRELPNENEVQRRRQQEAAYLSLDLQSDGQVYASSYVGQVWLDQLNNIVAKVRPRKYVDQFRMVNKCLESPSAGKYLLKNGFHFYSERPPLPVGKKDISFPLYLLIARYLRELSMLCKRHIKRGFPRTEQNLTGRCKGSVRIEQNIIHNTAKGRMDRLYCQFQTHSIDTPANQILKAALEQSLRFLRRHSQSTSLDSIWSWAGECSASLSQATLRRINPSEFQQIHCKGLMKAYKEPLNLAKMILRALGNDPNNPPDHSAQIILPPYAIDMNELFERYCEALLRQKFGNDLWAGYGYSDGKGFKIDNNKELRPDFLLKRQDREGRFNGWVLDAKYKPVPFRREDIKQVCFYARHKGVRDELLLTSEDEPVLVLIYPDFNNQISQNTINDFKNRLESENMDGKNEYIHQTYKILAPIPHTD